MCQIEFLVAYGEKFFKSIQIFQIFFYLLFAWFVTICEIYFPSLREQWPLVLREAHSLYKRSNVRRDLQSRRSEYQEPAVGGRRESQL